MLTTGFCTVLIWKSKFFPIHLPLGSPSIVLERTEAQKKPRSRWDLNPGHLEITTWSYNLIFALKLLGL